MRATLHVQRRAINAHNLGNTIGVTDAGTSTNGYHARADVHCTRLEA
jgi:hypothetical protein